MLLGLAIIFNLVNSKFKVLISLKYEISFKLHLKLIILDITNVHIHLLGIQFKSSKIFFLLHLIIQMFIQLITNSGINYYSCYIYYAF